ncbi:hypothetical protein CQA53_11430, partial [Helicobacter didelphidarum]
MKKEIQYEVEFVDDGVFSRLGKNPDSINEICKEFRDNIKNILGRDDYDFRDVKHIAFFVIFRKNGKNEVFIQHKKNFHHEEEVSISLIRSRLHPKIKKFLESLHENADSIQADFYLVFDESIQDVYKELGGKESERESNNANKENSQTNEEKDSTIEIKQLQPNIPNEKKENTTITLDLAPQTPRFKMEQIQLDKKTRKALQECITLVKKQPLI